MIAVLCSAGPDVQGAERKETGFVWGPIISVTPEEWLFQTKLALGCGA
jgi:hypothetical protein